MSLPPATVQIKRKATDEPVDFLRVQESGGKRQCRAGYVFSRQSTSLSHHAVTSLPPQTKSSRHIKQPHLRVSDHPARSTANSRDGKVASLGRSSDGSKNDGGSATTASGKQSPLTVPNLTLGNADIEDLSRSTVNGPKPRHFHMKRDLLGPQKRRRRAGTHSLTFAEHKIAKRDSKRKMVEISEALVNGLSEAWSTGSEASRPLKKPGLATRKDVNAGHESLGGKPSSAIRNKTPATITLPSGKTMPWDISSDVLAAEMQAYTLQEISKNISASNDRSHNSDSGSSPARKNASSKFKPKKPALRYQERNPDEARALDKAEGMGLDDLSTFEDTDDESEYIIDTYIRVPANTLESNGSLKNFGLLILDTQPDIDEFYLEEVDSDEEEEFDEDDENAENHYTADYPDEEVDSDDEFDINAFGYRHNLDEFDEDEATFSDDENDDIQFPWEKRVERRVVI
ncbi:hypothetical protein BJ875DRAFT_201917 [Amylocarpus encephaloides]|uniref:Transcription factor Iwr1 domain-containing protein n=1 Tax=Amylocarpus encephaloides TaxID=45428 RepID=A0A9P7YNK1_9HELO|nr:hypothetical protein BJ875DRAFT_201917 [Amylocarpus encephaloides]